MTRIRMLCFLLISNVLVATAIPLVPESETTRPSADDITLATDLQPPRVGGEEHHGFVYLINLYAVKNATSNSTDGEEGSQISDEDPEILGPLATVLLIIDDDEEEPKNLDNLAKDLEDEGYQVERIVEENGETKFVDVDVKDLKMKGKMKAELKKIRRKRCLKCGGGNGGGSGGYGGGGYGGGGGGYGGGGGGYGGGGGGYGGRGRGGGGGGYGGRGHGGRGHGGGGQGGGTVGVIPVAVIPVSIVPIGGGGGGGYHQQPSYGGGGGGGGGLYGGGGGYQHQPSHGGGGCNVCGGGGGGGGSGASAQASASASSWGK